ncbi:unnamed protein product [Parnassius mnemosyne]|uniref:DDE-1 domain-containing protein n=1 Tax=Parnassius mnemosyne TaxID=213953 RepID=A0AAV1KUJ1_9NEOP
MEKLAVQDKPAHIYNIDEKGCQMILHKSPLVLAQKGVKRVHTLASEHAENVTIVSCGNAIGNTIPPMILFKGKRLKPEWEDNLPPGSLVAMAPKGSMNSETFVKWRHHFAKFKTPGPCLLIFDGASSHLDYNIVDVANKHNKDKALTKQRFGRIFTPVWDKALTPCNIKSGFEATGIYPFNSDRIPECAYAPSIPNHLPKADEPQSNSDENNAASIINAASALNDESFSCEDNVPLNLFQSNEQQNVISSCIRDEPAPLASLEVIELKPVNPTVFNKPGPSNSVCSVQPIYSTNKVVVQPIVSSTLCNVLKLILSTSSSIFK